MPEILVIAVVAIIVVGPKDLPGLLRTAAKYVGQLRSMARDFQGQVSEAIKETELDDVAKDIKGIADLNPVTALKNEVSHYMDDDDIFEEPDADYIVAGEKMAAQKSATATKVTKPAPKKPVTKKTAAKKTGAKKPAARKSAAKKPAPRKAAAASVKNAPAKRAPSKHLPEMSIDKND